MKKYIHLSNQAATKSQRVKLKVVFEPYDRYTSSGIKTKIVKGEDLTDAIWNLADMMWYTLDGDSPEELIESLASQNGDGNDFIYLLKNMNTGEVYIQEGYEEDEEE